jgi:hypothetical protein
MATWSIGAPPAGGEAAAMSIRVLRNQQVTFA